MEIADGLLFASVRFPTTGIVLWWFLAALVTY